MQQSAIHRQAREAAQRTKALRDAALLRRSSPISTYFTANRRYASELAGKRRSWWPAAALSGVRRYNGFRPPTFGGRPWLRGIAMASGLFFVAVTTHALVPAATETAAGALMRVAPGSDALMEEFRQREECFSRLPVEDPTGQIAGVLRTGGCEGLPEGMRHSPPYLTAEMSTSRRVVWPILLAYSKVTIVAGEALSSAMTSWGLPGCWRIWSGANASVAVQGSRQH